MHTEVAINSMTAYVWCWRTACGSLDEIPSVTMGTYKRKFLMNYNRTLTVLSVRTHVCGSRHPTADLRQRIFPSFSFMFGCLHVSDSDLRHLTSDVRQRFFRSGTEKIGWQVTLDECRQNNGKVETKFAVANRPSDVVSRIHVYVD